MLVCLVMVQELSLIRSDLSPVTNFHLSRPVLSMACSLPIKHTNIFICCSPSWPADCCSVAGRERVNWTVIWRVGCPSTSSLVVNAALPKPSKVKAECVRVALTVVPQPIHSVLPRETVATWIGRCVYRDKVQLANCRHRQQHRHAVHMY